MENTLLDAVNYLCSSMNIYGVTKEYFIWLNRKMFKQVVYDIKEKASRFEKLNGPVDFDDMANGNKMIYKDPEGYTYTFQIADVFMITVQ